MKKLFLTFLILLFATNCFADFPTSGILDAFNRANEGPPPSASWTDVGSPNGLVVVSNAVKSNIASGTDLGIWGTDLGPDCELYITITAKGENGDSVWLGVRDSDHDGSSGYYAELWFSSGTDQIKLWNSDPWGQLGSTVNQETSVGDSIGISATGSTIEVWYKPVGDSWRAVITVTDITWSLAGSASLQIEDQVTVLDDFGGGTVVSGGAAPRQGQIVWIE
jgi:hypothetical protein